MTVQKESLKNLLNAITFLIKPNLIFKELIFKNYFFISSK